MRTAIDTNIISAIVGNQPGWEVLVGLLQRLRAEGALIVSAPVWAELGAHPQLAGQDITTFLRQAGVTVEFNLTKEVWAKAAEAHAAYAVRRRAAKADEPRRILADFLVGAHAVLCTERLLSLDHRFTELNFPGLKVVPIPGTSSRAGS